MPTYSVVSRKELKYYISEKEYLVLSNLFKNVLMEDKHNKKAIGGYFVRSLYFDTLNNKNFEEKMAGIEERVKYRLRLYDINSPWVKFEIKMKLNDSIIKETAVIAREDAAEIQSGNYEVMLAYNNKILNKGYKEFKRTKYIPVVMIDYLREAFNYEANDMRISFDRFLKSGLSQLDIFSKSAFLTRKLKKGLVVMEIKYNWFIPYWIKQIIQTPYAERSAISKYCIARLDYFEKMC